MAVGVCHPLLGDQLAHHEGGCWCLPRYGISRFVHVAGRALFVGRAKAAGCAASCISSTLLGVGSATAGVLLLLWHEFSRLSGSLVAVFTLLGGTAVWALGTQQLRLSMAGQKSRAMTAQTGWQSTRV